MTPYSTVYKAALGRILEDEWTEWTEDEIKEDLSGKVLESRRLRGINQRRSKTCRSCNIHGI